MCKHCLRRVPKLLQSVEFFRGYFTPTMVADEQRRRQALVDSRLALGVCAWSAAFAVLLSVVGCGLVTSLRGPEQTLSTAAYVPFPGVEGVASIHADSAAAATEQDTALAEPVARSGLPMYDPSHELLDSSGPTGILARARDVSTVGYYLGTRLIAVEGMPAGEFGLINLVIYALTRDSELGERYVKGRAGP